MTRFTTTQIRAKGNPDDVPFEVILRAMKKDRGADCEIYDGNPCGGFLSASRIDPSRVDSWDNLRLTCKRHTSD